MRKLRVGLLGCGTVGGGVIQLLRANAKYMALLVGAELEIAGVLVRDKARERVPELNPALLTTDPEALLSDATIDVFVEVMGGIDPAKGYVERAIDSGRSVVTANKMLLAVHGASLIRRAAAQHVDLAFEGSVGGGIPVIRVLRDALASDSIESLVGIVNGTCNYMLTRMRQQGLAFEVAVREAQERGYAEADPSLDVDGHDAAHKLAVLAMVAFGAEVDSGSIWTEGIRGIEPIDHRFADRFGFAIKHLAIGKRRNEALEMRVHPCLIQRDTTLANVGGVLNAIAVEGRALGPCLLSGRGAGDKPTAVSVVADLLDVSRARLAGTAGLMTGAIRLEPRQLSPMAHVECRYYLRFQVFDRPGILAQIAGSLGENSVSIEQMVQEGGGDSRGAPVQVVMLTHSAKEQDVTNAVEKLASSNYVAAKTRVIRVHE